MMLKFLLVILIGVNLVKCMKLSQDTVDRDVFNGYDDIKDTVANTMKTDGKTRDLQPGIGFCLALGIIDLGRKYDEEGDLEVLYYRTESITILETETGENEDCYYVAFLVRNDTNGKLEVTEVEGPMLLGEAEALFNQHAKKENKIAEQAEKAKAGISKKQGKQPAEGDAARKQQKEAAAKEEKRKKEKERQDKAEEARAQREAKKELKMKAVAQATEDEVLRAKERKQAKLDAKLKKDAREKDRDGRKKAEDDIVKEIRDAMDKGKEKEEVGEGGSGYGNSKNRDESEQCNQNTSIVMNYLAQSTSSTGSGAALFPTISNPNDIELPRCFCSRLSLQQKALVVTGLIGGAAAIFLVVGLTCDCIFPI